MRHPRTPRLRLGALLLLLLLLEHAPPLRRREPIHRYRGILCRRGYGKSSVASRAPG